jgi:glycosyltransferase involved in cell wall biosynthesis
VVAISEQLKEELILRGIDESKLWVVPNGVDLDTFSPREKDSKLLARYDLEGKIVIGFIGSIRKLEGLSLLLRHFPELTGPDDDVRLLLVGGGDEVAVLQELAGKLGIAGKVIFTGRVAHDEVLDYYSVIDIFVYPRIDSKVNQKVTPLKPLEAMAMRKAVVGSDVGGLRELIHEGVNGLIYRVDDGADLVRRCRELIENSSLRESLAHDARRWVERERDWKKIVLKYKELYADLARG